MQLITEDTWESFVCLATIQGHSEIYCDENPKLDQHFLREPAGTCFEKSYNSKSKNTGTKSETIKYNFQGVVVFSF